MQPPEPEPEPAETETETEPTAVDEDDEASALRALSNAVQEQLSEANGEGAAAAAVAPDPRELANYLVACGGVVPKAAHVFCRSHRWRVEKGIDGILDEPGGVAREERVRRYQQYVDGLCDRDGRPVAVWRAGRVPVRAMMEEVGAEAVLRNHVYLKERSLRRAREAGHASHVLVFDLAGLGMAQMDREGLAVLQRGIEIEQRHYPETFRECSCSAARTVSAVKRVRGALADARGGDCCCCCCCCCCPQTRSSSCVPPGSSAPCGPSSTRG
jgi:hypothetical protein